jgi:ATP-dependent helicase/nuclease subunit B
MGLTVITSAAGHHRIARCRDWLKARAPAEEILIIGATLGAANELARSLAQEKRASFGYHRLTLAQLASALARPVLTAQRTVPLGALGIQAVANRAIHRLSEAGGLGRYAKLTSGPGFARAIANIITELRLEQIEPDTLTQVARLKQRSEIGRASVRCGRARPPSYSRSFPFVAIAALPQPSGE